MREDGTLTAREFLLWDSPVFAYTLVHLTIHLDIYNKMIAVAALIS